MTLSLPGAKFPQCPSHATPADLRLIAGGFRGSSVGVVEDDQVGQRAVDEARRGSRSREIVDRPRLSALATPERR